MTSGVKTNFILFFGSNAIDINYQKKIIKNFALTKKVHGIYFPMGNTTPHTNTTLM